jgi:hypothetical protein
MMWTIFLYGDLPRSDLKLYVGVHHGIATVRSRSRIAVLGHTNIVLDQDIGQHELDSVTSEKPPKPNVATTSEDREIWTALNKLTRLATCFSCMQELVVVIFVRVGIDFRISE